MSDIRGLYVSLEEPLTLVTGSFTLVGVADVHGYLEPHQIFGEYPRDIYHSAPLSDPSMTNDSLCQSKKQKSGVLRGQGPCDSVSSGSSWYVTRNDTPAHR